jgi:hypothetical protein
MARNKDSYSPEEVRRYAELYDRLKSAYKIFSASLFSEKEMNILNLLKTKSLALIAAEKLLDFEKNVPENVKNQIKFNELEKMIFEQPEIDFENLKPKEKKA